LKIIDHSADIVSKLVQHQFLRFAMVGGIGTLGHYTVLIFLVSGLHIHPVIGSTAGFIVGMVINYLLNRSFTFASTRAHREAFWRFAAVALLGMFINSSAMALFTMALDFHYLVAQVLATLMTLSWNFMGSRNWVFNDRKN
jgi:putative flippase GtrA